MQSAEGAGTGGLGRRESTADGAGAAADAELEAAVLDTLTDVVLTGAPGARCLPARMKQWSARMQKPRMKAQGR